MLHAQPRQYSWTGFILLVVLFIGLVPFPRTILQEWTVRVVNEHGIPMQGIRVSCELDDYTYGLSFGWDLYTNVEGKVVFPKTTLFRPAIYWIAKATWNLINLLGHASFGIRGRVWISDPQAADHESVVCSRQSCTAQKLETELPFVPN
jgi:hypothetical protein